MNVAWTRRSIFRLRQILEHIAKDQPENARRFVDRLIEVFEGDYRIIYWIGPDRVDILTVRHGAQILPADVQAL